MWDFKKINTSFYACKHISYADLDVAEYAAHLLEQMGTYAQITEVVAHNGDCGFMENRFLHKS